MSKQALMLRVGADTSAGGTLAPIFEDGTWYYITIPESRPSDTLFPFTYEEIPTPDNRYTLADWLPKRLRNQKPHYDPEFWLFTYGEPLSSENTNIKPTINQLKKLRKGDLLLFTAGLVRKSRTDPPAVYRSKFDPKWQLYLIGVFEVESTTKVPRGASMKFLRKNQLYLNAHALRRPRKSFLAVKGKEDSSFLLKYPLQLTASPNKTAPEDRKAYPRDELKSRGLEKISFRSGAGNWVPESALSWILNNIDETAAYPQWISRDRLFEAIYDSLFENA